MKAMKEFMAEAGLEAKKNKAEFAKKNSVSVNSRIIMLLYIFTISLYVHKGCWFGSNNCCTA